MERLLKNSKKSTNTTFVESNDIQYPKLNDHKVSQHWLNTQDEKYSDLFRQFPFPPLHRFISRSLPIAFNQWIPPLSHFFSLCLICCLLSQYIVLSSLSLSLCFLSSLTLIYLRLILLFLSVPYPYVYRTFRFPSKQILCQWIFAIVMYVWWEAAKKFTKITLFHIIYPKHTTECMKKSPHHQSSIVWYSFT